MVVNMDISHIFKIIGAVGLVLIVLGILKKKRKKQISEVDFNKVVIESKYDNPHILLEKKEEIIILLS